MTPAKTSSTTVENTSGVSRRTIMTGAAWSIPLIMASTATPALAASTDDQLTIAWTTTAAAMTIGRVFGASEVLVSAGGTPAPIGTQVTFALSTGLAWADGTTGSKIVSTINGIAALPAAKATATGSHSVTAIVGTVSVGTTLTATAVATGEQVFNFTADSGAVLPAPMVEMSVGMDWLTFRSAESTWYGYAYANNTFRPLTYKGSPLIIDADIKTENSNSFFAVSNGQIYEARLQGQSYVNAPYEATLRGAPPSGIAGWAANTYTLYAVGNDGEWYTNSNTSANTTWTKVATSVPTAYPSGTIRQVYSIQAGSEYSWAITENGDVWCNLGSPQNRTNSLSPMKDLAIGATVAYGTGTDGKWYAKLWGNTTAAWTRVQFEGSDFVLEAGDRMQVSEGNTNYAYVLRGDGTIYRTDNGGSGATQKAVRFEAPSKIRSFVGGTGVNCMIAGEDGRMWRYNGSVWSEVLLKKNSVDALQVGYRDDGQLYEWGFGTAAL